MEDEADTPAEPEHIYVITPGKPRTFRFMGYLHKVEHVLVVSAEGGKLVHRWREEPVDGRSSSA